MKRKVKVYSDEFKSKKLYQFVNIAKDFYIESLKQIEKILNTICKYS